MQKICKHCKSTVTVEKVQGEVYCKYCGSPIFNYCSNEQSCGVELDDDAAYCTKCGSRSIFLNSDLVVSKHKVDKEYPF
jgi:DNA-directed RNA polymerase subunit RPC12/RpoP